MEIGDRLSSTHFLENKRPFHNFGNKIVRWDINSIFKGDIKNIMTGYRGFSYDFVKTFPVLSRGFEMETEMTVHAIDKNMYLETVIINYKDRPEGSVSKLNTVSDGPKVISIIWRLWKNYKPFYFFMFLSATLILIAAAIFITLVLISFLQSGFVCVAALISFFSGLILETLVQKEKREFEFSVRY